MPEAQPGTRSGGTEAAGRIAAWVAGLTLAAPVLAFRYPPMGDLPMHESLVALLRHLGDPSLEPAGLYQLNLGPPNQLFHWLAWGLALGVPTDHACKLVIAAAVAATPVAGTRLARQLGTTAWSGVLVAPLALGFAFRWGLVGNVVALPLLLLVLPTLGAFARAPSARRGAAAVACAVLLYCAHESALVVYAMATGIFALRSPRSVALVAVRAIPAAACALLAAFGVWVASRFDAPVVAGAYGPVLQRVPDIPGVLFGSGDALVTYAPFGLYALAVATFVARARAAGAVGPPTGAWLERGRFALVGAGCAALYLVAPLSLAGPTLIYQRFLAMACALLVVASAPAVGAALGRVPPVAAVAAVAALLLATLPRFADTARGFEELDRLIPQIARGSAVAQLDLTPRPPSRVAPVPGAAGRVLAERGGRLLFSFTNIAASPVVTPPRTQWNEAQLRMVADPAAFRPAHDFRRFRYALVRLATSDPQLAGAIALAMTPEGRLVDASGAWLLFESTLPVVPPASPDAPLPVPPPSSLRDRLGAPRD